MSEKNINEVRNIVKEIKISIKELLPKKGSVFGVFLVNVFECRKIKTRKTPNTDTFHAVNHKKKKTICNGAKEMVLEHPA